MSNNPFSKDYKSQLVGFVDTLAKARSVSERATRTLAKGRETNSGYSGITLNKKGRRLQGLELKT